MPSNSAQINPIEFADSWHFVTVGGMASPGVIAIDGIRGFDRETGWDKKKGKGTQGATLTLTSFPPAEGSFEFVLWTPDHFIDWQKFLQVLKYDPTKKKGSGGAEALDIYHPSLADIGISRVVTAKVSPITHKGLGKYVVTVDFIEWINPPKQSVVATTNTSKTNKEVGKKVGDVPKAIQDANAELNAALLQNASTPYEGETLHPKVPVR